MKKKIKRILGFLLVVLPGTIMGANYFTPEFPLPYAILLAFGIVAGATLGLAFFLWFVSWLLFSD